MDSGCVGSSGTISALITVNTNSTGPHGPSAWICSYARGKRKGCGALVEQRIKASMLAHVRLQCQFTLKVPRQEVGYLPGTGGTGLLQTLRALPLRVRPQAAGRPQLGAPPQLLAEACPTMPGAD